MIIKDSIKTGASFGFTTGIITTLGLMVGLHAGTNSLIAVIGGIITIALADAFSDSLGVHISQESRGKFSKKEVWEATFATFFAKVFFASIFIIPVLLFELATAIVVSVVAGMLLLAVFSYRMALSQKQYPWGVVTEHVLIGMLVVASTHFVGLWIATVFV